MKNKNFNKKGFSLAEVVVAMFVLVAGLGAVIALMSSNLNNSIDSRNKIIASELTQEGLELARNVRDNGMLSENPFGNFPSSGSQCRIDYDHVAFSCSGSFSLLLDANGFYQYDTGSSTRFTRKVIVEDDSPSGGKKITSIVGWDGQAKNLADCDLAHKCVYAQSILTDWAE